MACMEPTTHEDQAYPKEPGWGHQPSWRRDLPLLLLALVAAFFAGASLVLLMAPRPPGEDSPDVRFARDMMVHHAQEVEMAEIVRDKTKSDEIRTLATDIALTQQAQIGMMQGWLDVWGLPASGTEPAMSWMGTPTEGVTPGMATPQEIDRLREAPPEVADEQFLWLMIRHYWGGIAMAEAILKRTERPEVRQLAGANAASQRQEIRTMEAMSREHLVNFARLRLEPVDDSGVSGTATFKEVDGGARVELAVEELPKAGTTYLAHIHHGTCEEAAEAEGHEGGEDHHHGQEEEGPPTKRLTTDTWTRGVTWRRSRSP
jgi:uncharacterized protein (DUF305 family)